MDLQETIHNIEQRFQKQSEYVIELANFDQEVLEFSLACLEGLKNHIKPGLPTNGFENKIQLLKNIKNNDSMKEKYERINSQCVVLLVSYLSAALSDIFKAIVTKTLKAGDDLPFKEAISIKANDLTEIFSRDGTRAAEVILRNRSDISFQDMQSTRRSFKDYLGVEFNPEESLRDDIIFIHACRHIFAHSGTKTNERFMRQIRVAKNRTFFKEIQLDSELKFTTPDLVLLGTRMSTFLHELKTSCLSTS